LINQTTNVERNSFAEMKIPELKFLCMVGSLFFKEIEDG